MSKRILIINGHPDGESFNYGLADAYRRGATQTGATVKELAIAELQFDPILRYGYRKRIELEPDLLDALEKICWAEHLVWVHPVWWGGFPALLKGVIDRLFLPGIAFQYRKDSVWWDKLFAGKTARIITTLDQPAWYYNLVFGSPSVNQLRKSVLIFCGIKPVKVTYIGPLRNSGEQKRTQWLKRIFQLGSQLS